MIFTPLREEPLVLFTRYASASLREKCKLVALNQGFEYQEKVTSRSAGSTVLHYLSRRYRHSSVGEWRVRLESGLILLDGSPAAAQAVLQTGQMLVWRRPPWNEPDVPLCYGVLYEDGELLAVAKPAGLPTLPAGGFFMHTLFTLVRKSYPEATPVHRLGRGTSGIVLFARTSKARRALHRDFRQGSMVKIYRALASGHPVQDGFSIDVPIGPLPHARLSTVHAASASGRRALSRVTVLQRLESCSLLRVDLKTGRPHQIRIHLAAAGHPLVGDPLYTNGGRFNPSGSVLPGETGYWLHAEKICLDHPDTGLPLEITCSPPPELRRSETASAEQQSLTLEGVDEQCRERGFEF